MPERFPLVDIREMHLNGWDLDCHNRIAYCNTGMRVAGRINDDGIEPTLRVLNPRDQFAFHIRLPDVHSNAFLSRQLFDGRINLFQRQRSVHRAFPRAEEIEVWSM